MELGILFLLLPIASLSGWWIGRRSRVEEAEQKEQCPADYFKGLNYLINDQTDKATEVFIRMVEVGSETIELHLALASLFRRKGEVERAIRIHQNLIARPTLSAYQRSEAVYELARDYQSAGLLDRAEQLFLELLDDPEFSAKGSLGLLEVYEQEREWERAISVAEQAHSRLPEPGKRIAHYHCELAEMAAHRNEPKGALQLIQMALSADRNSVRASLLQGKIELSNGNYRQAVQALRRIEQQNPEFVPESMGLVLDALTHAGQPGERLSYLNELMVACPSTAVVLAWCEELKRVRGPAITGAELKSHLEKHPSILAMKYLIQLELEQQPAQGLSLLNEMAEPLAATKPKYHCNQCGFVSHTLYWLCPGCKHWGTVKPTLGKEREK